MTQQHVFIIEDNEGICKLTQKQLRRLGYTSQSVHTGEDAINWLTANKTDLILLDFSLPDATADSILDQMEEKGIQIPFIIITGHGNEK